LDTFVGFDQRDIKGVDGAAREQAFSDTSLESVRALVGEQSVRYVQGYFPETSGQIPDDTRFCLVHIDCDLYQPISSALDFFYPRLVPGGYLIVHDYTSPDWTGAERAVDDFFLDKPEPVIPLPDSAGSVVIRRLRQPKQGIDWRALKRARLPWDEWISAGDNGVGDLLGTGWSGPERWGIWGSGEQHELVLTVPGAEPGEVKLELDVHAALIGSRTAQTVAVLLDGKPLARWNFSANKNRDIRSIHFAVPAALAPDMLRSVMLVFRPDSIEPPSMLVAGHTERRPLGMALHRLRLTFHER
jgi:hypothetical protein